MSHNKKKYDVTLSSVEVCSMAYQPYFPSMNSGQALSPKESYRQHDTFFVMDILLRCSYINVYLDII